MLGIICYLEKNSMFVLRKVNGIFWKKRRPEVPNYSYNYTYDGAFCDYSLWLDPKNS